jgi:hypothetical protein
MLLEKRAEGAVHRGGDLARTIGSPDRSREQAAGDDCQGKRPDGRFNKTQLTSSFVGHGAWSATKYAREKPMQ